MWYLMNSNGNYYNRNIECFVSSLSIECMYEDTDIDSMCSDLGTLSEYDDVTAMSFTLITNFA